MPQPSARTTTVCTPTALYVGGSHRIRSAPRATRDARVSLAVVLHLISVCSSSIIVDFVALRKTATHFDGVDGPSSGDGPVNSDVPPSRRFTPDFTPVAAAAITLEGAAPMYAVCAFDDVLCAEWGQGKAGEKWWKRGWYDSVPRDVDGGDDLGKFGKC